MSSMINLQPAEPVRRHHYMVESLGAHIAQTRQPTPSMDSGARRQGYL